MAKQTISIEILILGVIVVAALVYFKSRPSSSVPQIGGATYDNAEDWDVQYNAIGMPIKVTIHRHATRGLPSGDR